MRSTVSSADLGPETADPVDYPDMADKLATALKDGRAQRGLLVCGTGIGIAIAANHYPWIQGRRMVDVTAARLPGSNARTFSPSARPDRADVVRDCLLASLKPACRGPCVGDVWQ